MQPRGRYAIGVGIARSTNLNHAHQTEECKGIEFSLGGLGFVLHCSSDRTAGSRESGPKAMSAVGGSWLGHHVHVSWHQAQADRAPPECARSDYAPGDE